MKAIRRERSSFTLSLYSKSIAKPSGSKGQSAVHDERLSAHVGGEGGGKEQRDSGHLFDGSEAAHGNLLEGALAPLFTVHVVGFGAV